MYIDQFLLVISMFSVPIRSELEFEQLEKHYGSLDKERNRVNYFQYIKLSTEIPAEWSALPQIPKDMNLEKVMGKKYSCPVQLAITFLNYKASNGTICLFKEALESSLFTSEAKITMDASESSPAEFYKELQPVTGFVMHETDTVVSGYVINKQFYGTIQLFDMRHGYHIIYYLEPIENLILYNTDENPVHENSVDGLTNNAILFEYISHEDVSTITGRKKRDINKNLPQSEELNANTISQNRKSYGYKYFRRNMQKSSRDRKNTHNLLNPPENSNKISKRAIPPAKVDTSYFNVENTLFQGQDVIDTIPYGKGASVLEVFEMRRGPSYQCNLCVWIQPNFADKFGYGGGQKFGVGEVLKIISRLNWVFRTIDFNGDGIPEKIGFAIKHLIVTDEVDIGSTTHTKGPSGFVDDIETISAVDAFPPTLLQLKNKFPQCCAIIGFVYHNMAPSVSTTTLRGLCGEKNVAIISGFMHAHKIPLYDVFRGMFHAIGHLFGAPHDNPFSINCRDKLTRFLNPLLMHPAHQINVGFRPNSMRYTVCSKLQISRFLSSSGAKCLVDDKAPYCGNGIKDDNEECDCGNSWQCYNNKPEEGLCCGLRNTVLGCKLLAYNEGCPRSYTWPRVFIDEK